MPELKSYVCPNCGANTTDTQNCEYCGSLLVRFVEHGIDLNNTCYTNNDSVIPGLIDALTENIELQRAHPDHEISTVVQKEFVDEDGEICEDIDRTLIVKSRNCVWEDGVPIFEKNNKELELIVRVTFDVDGQRPDCIDYQMNQEMHANFKALKSAPLFVHRHFITYGRDKKKNIMDVYAINFGQDVEGAARLISELFTEVFGCDSLEMVRAYTDDESIVGQEQDCPENNAVAQPVSQAAEASDNGGCLGVIAFGVILACSLLFI